MSISASQSQVVSRRSEGSVDGDAITPPQEPELIPGVVRVPIRAICQADSPRSAGVDMDYARSLAEVEADLPPIVVNRRTMRVIDGMHRLSAAALKGKHLIEVVFFDGTDHEAFLLSVRLNVTHGMPLN